jgi:hypothetical protein
MKSCPGLRDSMRGAGSIALVVLALVAGVVSGATLPHTHGPGGVGLYNQEHDLSLLAALAGSGTLPASPDAMVVALALLVVPAPPTPRLVRRSPARSPSRAPPRSA